MKQFPRVLLLGNGINISNGGEKWKEFLHSIQDYANNIDVEKLNSPMPLQAILVSGDKLDSKLKEKREKLLPTKELKDINIPLFSILSMEFDHILTTNYTYELEQACFDNQPLSEYQLKKLSINTSDRSPDAKYLIKTYNQMSFNGIPQKIWHIHGEARRYSSMILGHYYYGNLMNRIIEYLANKKNSYLWHQNNNVVLNINSWIDAFIMGDVYILGQGFDFSEIDLWWLLNRKYNEKANHGNVYFYEPYKKSEQEKIQLLRIFNVDVRDMGIRETMLNGKSIIDYEQFYKNALNDIKKEMHKNG